MTFAKPLTALAAALLALTGTPADAEAQKRPNFLIIIADDLGYSDIGAFGGEIATPNLDRLALTGLRLTGFHTAPTCSPTRAMLLSGTDNHLAGLGSMAETLAPNQRGKPGFEGYLRPDVASLAERLSAGGYRTLFSGKWHLGLKPEQDPHARGFQRSFALLQGGHNHFGQGLSTDPARGDTYTLDGKPLAQLPADFYSSDVFATKLIEALNGTGGAKKPFFAYLAFTAPHWPLQARPEDIAKYRGRYDAGFDVLRAQRLKRQRELGLISPQTVAHSTKVPRGHWDALTAAEQRQAARDMEIYAAMVDRLDQNVGRVLDALRASGELDNTVILFMADNGAEGLDVEGGGLKLLEARLARADNSFANRGTATSYVAYGPGWAQAATAPSWSVKGYATEGGTRTVSFLNWRGIARQGQTSNAFLSVADIAPTFLDLAGIARDGTSFAGRAVRPITGKSWAPFLAGKADRVYGVEEAIGTELFGSRAIRQGDWKITDPGDGKWRLFNLAEDPGETQDLSLAEPERFTLLLAAWDSYAERVGVILPSETLYRP
ncbi:arylsulfatase [Sphingobium sp. SYK-6]|uniref:arylsulfatase n=1 Tax=Sphingobium sp. (strain NBRC 103272 / SYK-6) TaxID=627192 RepID=UPI0002276685|nr:arylsulfatase [Sphingobium sp. SYK-6]BAK65736.1 arylsulfatase [Sphingobium sp. SYK-6]